MCGTIICCLWYKSLASFIIYNHLCYTLFFFYLTIAGKVFPGSLSLKRDFKEGMNDRKSELFQETAGPIEKVVRD